MSRGYLDGEKSSPFIIDFNLVVLVRDDAGEENSSPKVESIKGPMDLLRLYSEEELFLRYSSRGCLSASLKCLY